jgi:hypothetical protein
LNLDAGRPTKASNIFKHIPSTENVSRSLAGPTQFGKSPMVEVEIGNVIRLRKS